MRTVLFACLLFVAASIQSAFGEADGPDFFRVVNVAADDALNIRTAPDADADRIGAIPPDTDGVRNLGCQGGLGFAEWEKATPAEREAAARNRWCRVSWGGVEGWVAARFLAEGAAPAATEMPATGVPAADVPAAPEDGGPRNWEVAGVATALNLREEPSTTARVLARYVPGTILSNLGCRRVEGRAWCDVQEVGGGPRGFVAADYLRPAVAPDGAVAAGPDESSLRAGQGDFDATGKVPCAQYPGQPMAQCDFGVARSGGGDATVVVTRPDGTRRALFFARGRFVSADTSQADGYPAVGSEKQSDLNRISVGDERYEIPDAVIFGG
ncbi:SH3 domain-containing protein [Microbaculum marinisediminis]|uniref:SH3 domain-containing protein n=1 Tax=Microbaculum marinisediminis TaxID=2931392 RepID=A0AAW5QZP2_9HYPH|nr:SH3 domain-containing protein [Microbaculum sp. A6E488]MCT8972607.1 SH3 domain-containing protein [Microbaculum sp. A6E488]